MNLYAKELSDPLYGFIGLFPEELPVIDSIPFQRLRNIKQLGGAYLVFPSAQHTRFEHSVGVMFVADSIYDRIKDSLFADQTDKEYYRKIVRLSALLHDIGHPPFSHTAEVLIPDKKNHEHMTKRIIRETPLKDIIKKSFLFNDEDIERIIRVATGKPNSYIEKTLTDIITGEFGADRIDYLRRDALFCGVSYGLFDYQRLLNTIGISDSGRLCINISGLRALENFIISRYFMYMQVYFHKVVRIMNLHILDLMKDILQKFDSNDINNYIKLNDTYILSLLFTDNKYKKHAERILERKHFREIFSTKNRNTFEKVKNVIIERFGTEYIRFDEVVKELYEGNIIINVKGSEVPAEEVSDLIANIKPIERYSIYSADNIKEEACCLLKRLHLS